MRIWTICKSSDLANSYYFIIVITYWPWWPSVWIWPAKSNKRGEIFNGFYEPNGVQLTYQTWNFASYFFTRYTCHIRIKILKRCKFKMSCVGRSIKSWYMAIPGVWLVIFTCIVKLTIWLIQLRTRSKVVSTLISAAMIIIWKNWKLNSNKALVFRRLSRLL